MPIIKIILLGDTSVGKTSFLDKYLKRDFLRIHKPTIAADMTTKHIDINNTSITLQIWDTAGEERFNSLTSLYYRKTNIAIILYDITNPHSFIRAQDCYNDIIRKGPKDIIIGLIGNKSDIAIKNPQSRTIPFSVGKDWADTHNIWFAETNIFNDNDVKCVFETLLYMIPDNILYANNLEQDSLLDNLIDNDTNVKNNYNECCNIS